MDEPLGAIHVYDPSRPSSGHEPHAEDAPPASLAPEHDWAAAADVLFPVLRPVGTVGLPLDAITAPAQVAGDAHPLVEAGPCGLVVAFAMNVGRFHVLVNGDHLASWEVAPAEVRERAHANLGAWSRRAPWSEDASGRRRVVSSDTGDGWDASRILVPDAVEELTRRVGPGARILVGLPERHLLIAGSLFDDDPEFAALFADFVLEYSGDSDEPIDRRVFELVDGQLVEFAGVAVPA